MAFLTIDETKCKQDGICAAECPRRIIIQKDDKSFPQIVQADEVNCMACGHCVAVCPHGTMSHKIMKSVDCPPVEKELFLTPEQVEQFLRYRRGRRGIRNPFF